jgi:hypothetical protein
MNKCAYNYELIINCGLVTKMSVKVARLKLDFSARYLSLYTTERGN